MDESQSAPLTLSEFIEMSYSGLKAKFDLSTEEEKAAIIARLNAILPGLGDALSNERADLDRVASQADNPKEVVDALLPLTNLQGIQIGEIERQNTSYQTTP